MTLFRVLRNYPGMGIRPQFIADIEADTANEAMDKAPYFDADSGIDWMAGKSRTVEAHYEAHVLANASHRVVPWHDARYKAKRKAKKK